MATNINQTLEDLIDAISGLAGQSEACCEVGGQRTDDPPSDGAVVYGEGEDYPDAESYFNAKCSAANGIYDTVRGTIDWLRDNNVDLKAGVLGSVTTAIVLGLALSGPVGWAIQLSGVVLTVVAGFVIKSVLDFIDMLDGLDDVHEELVLALYNASDTSTARENFLTVFAGATPAPGSIELTLTRLLLPASMLNQLYVPRPDVGSYESPDPIDCGAALLAYWTFPSDAEGWVFQDDSDAPSSATGAYNAVLKSLEITMMTAGGGGQPRARGTWVKTGLTIVVEPGSSAQFDFSATSDGFNQTKWMKVTYSDATSDEQYFPQGSEAGTLVMTLPSAKTIAKIECQFSRAWALVSTHTSDVLEVRVFGAT